MPKLKRKILATVSRELAQAHHDAYLIELLGQARSGISPERIQSLLSQGVLDASKLGGVVITGMTNVADPFLFMRMVAQAIEKAPSENRIQMRQWSLDQWKTEVDKAIDAERAGLPKPEFPSTGSTIELPGPPEAARGAVIGATSAPYTDDLPDWLDNKSKAAYKQAIERAGEFCRGLGNQLADDLHNVVAETWDGDEILSEVDAERRQDRLKIIQETVGEAITTHKSAKKLARDLANKTKYYSHNWERIARTELQGVYNEGVILDAIEYYGEETQVARVTETGACPHCRRLFRNSEGKPKIFPIAELIANGTNVGRRARDWQATIWPVHPNCRCDTMVVPPGLVVTEDGRLRRPEEK